MILSINSFENVLNPGADSRDLQLNAEQRKALYEQLERYGMPRSTAYNRIFREGNASGFEDWEILGIRKVVQDFCTAHNLPLPEEKELPSFYQEKLDGHREKLWLYMGPLGLSKVTCLYRFKLWDFKEWELKGIRSIIDELCQRES